MEKRVSLLSSKIHIDLKKGKIDKISVRLMHGEISSFSEGDKKTLMLSRTISLEYRLRNNEDLLFHYYCPHLEQAGIQGNIVDPLHLHQT